MVTEHSKALDEAEIHALLENRVKAVRAKDLSGVMSNIAPNILSFDVTIPLQGVGSEASKTHAKEWFASFRGPIGHEIWDLSITSGEDIAFTHSLNRVIATSIVGNKIDMFWRATVCYRKLEGKWMITHEHNSVPFDPASGRAALDLKP